MRLIFARDPLGGIGNHGAIPWSDPAEMRLFKATTRGSSLIAGRKTATTLPILVGRRVIVVGNPTKFTDHHHNQLSDGKETHKRICIPTLEDAIEFTRFHSSVWLIGGAVLFHHALKAKLITEVRESVMQVTYPADTFFKPNWEALGFKLGETQKFSTFTHYKWICASS